MTHLHLDEIKIGPRHRKDLGDLDALAASIRDVGLLHPIVVTKDNRLVAGMRRYAACQALGWRKIPVTVVDLVEIVRGEFAENMARKDFLISEAAAIAETLEPQLAAEADRRMKAGTPSEKFTKGRAKDHVAAYAGISRPTLERATEIIEAAKAEPEKYAKLAESMDRTGLVNGLYKRLVVARKAEVIRNEPPPLPGKGPYRVIVADPPWPYEQRQEDPSHRANTPYPSMSIAQICALDVPSIAAPDCILWLWTTNFHMRHAFTVLDAWGFESRTILTWVKDRMGTGDWLRGRTEHCIMAGRGKPVITLGNQTTVLMGPLREHSRKPDEFYALVESLCPAPRYAELFQRHARPGWDGHGDEAQALSGDEKASSPHAVRR